MPRSNRPKKPKPYVYTQEQQFPDDMPAPRVGSYLMTTPLGSVMLGLPSSSAGVVKFWMKTPSIGNFYMVNFFAELALSDFDSTASVKARIAPPKGEGAGFYHWATPLGVLDGRPQHLTKEMFQAQGASGVAHFGKMILFTAEVHRLAMYAYTVEDMGCWMYPVRKTEVERNHEVMEMYSINPPRGFKVRTRFKERREEDFNGVL